MPCLEVARIALLIAIPAFSCPAQPGQDPVRLPKPAPTKPPLPDAARAALAKRLGSAIDAKDLATVRQVLAEGASLELGVGTGAGDKSRTTPLVRAVRGNDRQLVELLVERGARLDRADDEGNTPLQAAARNGNAELVRMLLRQGARLHHKDSSGATVRVDVGSDPEIARIVGEAEQKQEALFRAIHADETGAIRAAIAAGASPNANDGSTCALLHAVTKGDRASVEALLALGCRSDLALVDGLSFGTPLGAAAEDQSLELLRLLLSPSKPHAMALDDALAHAAGSAKSDRKQRVELLLAAGADPTRATLLQGPALAAAARHGDLETMAVLLSAGADRYAADSALMSASGIEDRDRALATVRALLAVGADASFLHFSTTTLGAAARHGNLAVMEVLFEHVNDEALNTAVAEAARAGYQAGLQWLCEHAKARVDYGFVPSPFPSALVAAIKGDHVECLRTMLAAGAKPDQEPNLHHGTPLIEAIEAKNATAVSVLLAAGADPTRKWKLPLSGTTSALAVAKQGGDREILALLETAATRLAKDPLGGVLARIGVVHEDVGGLYRIRYSNRDTNRQQVVFVRKSVEKYETLQVQEVFSLCYDAKEPPSAKLLTTAFLTRFGIGGLVLEEPGETQKNWRIRFHLHAPCDATAEKLAALLQIAQSTADELEKELNPDAKDRL